MTQRILFLLVFLSTFLSPQQQNVLCNQEFGTPFVSSRFDNLTVSSSKRLLGYKEFSDHPLYEKVKHGVLPFRGVIVSGSGGDSNAANNSSIVSLNQLQ